MQGEKCKMENAKLRVDRRRRTGVRGREKLGVMAKVVGISETFLTLSCLKDEEKPRRGKKKLIRN